MRINKAVFVKYSLILLAMVFLYFLLGETTWLYIGLFQIFYLFSAFGLLWLVKSPLKGSLRLNIGENMEVEIRINQSPLYWLYKNSLTLSCRNNYTGEVFEEYFDLTPFKRDNLKKINLKNNKYPGQLSLFVEMVEVSDIFSIFSKAITLNIGKDTYLYPKEIDLTIPREELEYFSLESYNYSQSKAGNDTNETFSIDEYKDGDSVKTIHWKLSEKLDKIMVRMPSLPVDSDIGLVFLKNYEVEDLSPKYKEKLLDNYFSLCKKILYNSEKFIGYFPLGRGFESLKVESEKDLVELIERIMISGFSNFSPSIKDLVVSEAFQRQGLYILVGSHQSGEEILGEYGKVLCWVPEK